MKYLKMYLLSFILLTVHSCKENPIKIKVQEFFAKFGRHRDSSTYNQADGRVDVNNVESKGDASSLEQVVQNENASLPDKSYSFDEETTGANYDLEDDLDFENDDDESGQQSRYA